MSYSIALPPRFRSYLPTILSIIERSEKALTTEEICEAAKPSGIVMRTTEMQRILVNLQYTRQIYGRVGDDINRNNIVRWAKTRSDAKRLRSLVTESGYVVTIDEKKPYLVVKALDEASKRTSSLSLPDSASEAEIQRAIERASGNLAIVLGAPKGDLLASRHAAQAHASPPAPLKAPASPPASAPSVARKRRSNVPQPVGRSNAPLAPRALPAPQAPSVDPAPSITPAATAAPRMEAEPRSPSKAAKNDVIKADPPRVLMRDVAHLPVPTPSPSLLAAHNDLDEDERKVVGLLQAGGMRSPQIAARLRMNTDKVKHLLRALQSSQIIAYRGPDWVLVA